MSVQGLSIPHYCPPTAPPLTSPPDYPSGLRRPLYWSPTLSLSPNSLSPSFCLGYLDTLRRIWFQVSVIGSPRVPLTPNRSNFFCTYFPLCINVLRRQLVIQNNTSHRHPIQSKTQSLYSLFTRFNVCWYVPPFKLEGRNTRFPVSRVSPKSVEHSPDLYLRFRRRCNLFTYCNEEWLSPSIARYTKSFACRSQRSHWPDTFPTLSIWVWDTSKHNSRSIAVNSNWVTMM